MAETAKGAVEVTEPTRAQVAVARRAAESKATVPDTSLALEADAPEPFLAGVVHAVAGALREHPRANGAYRDARFEAYARVNVGLAIDAGGALVAPVVLDADRKTAEEIAGELDALSERARAGTLTAAELAGATLTIVALDARRVVPVIVPPQAAALGVGAPEERAVVRGGEVVVRRVAELTLVSDHRILYGAAAAEFLRAVQRRLAL